MDMSITEKSNFLRGTLLCSPGRSGIHVISLDSDQEYSNITLNYCTECDMQSFQEVRTYRIDAINQHVSV